MRAAIAYGFVLALTLFSAALAAGFGQIGQRDAQGIYLSLGAPSEPAEWAQLGARVLGPAQAPFATLVWVEPDRLPQIAQAGHWLLPASALAAICGVAPTFPESS